MIPNLFFRHLFRSSHRFIVMCVLFVSTVLTSQAQRYQVGDIVENFTLIDRVGGQEVSLYELEGQVIFLEWFAYWCPFCQAAAADVGTGIVDHYGNNGGNPNGVPVMHVGLNLQGGAESSTQNFVDFYEFEFVLNDFNRAVASRFQSGGQPIFAIINGVKDSSSHEQWELIYSHLGYGDLTQPIDDFRAAINTVDSAELVPGFEDYLNDIGVPQNQRAEDDDPDFDGVPNVFEYLAGTSALDTASSFTPVNKIVTIGEAQYQALEYINKPDANDLTAAVQFSNHPDFSALNVSVHFTSETLESGFERVVVRSGNVLGPGSEFSRLFLNIEDSQN